jgi:hypothetical protein
MPHTVDASLQPAKKTFFPLTQDFAAILRSIDLTAAEWRVWSLISTEDSFGDRAISFDIKTVMKECRISRSTFYSAINTLERHGLVAVEVVERRFFNSFGAREILVKSSPKNQTVSEKSDCPIKFSDTNPTVQTSIRNFGQSFEERPQNPCPERVSESNFPDHTKSNNLKTLSQISIDPPPTPEPELNEVNEVELIQFIEAEVRKGEKIQNIGGYTRTCLKNNKKDWIRKLLEAKAHKSQISEIHQAAATQVIKAQQVRPDLGSNEAVNFADLLDRVRSLCAELGWSVKEAIGWMIERGRLSSMTRLATASLHELQLLFQDLDLHVFHTRNS